MLRLKTRFRECCLFVFSAPVYSLVLERSVQLTRDANPKRGKPSLEDLHPLEKRSEVRYARSLKL